MASVYHLAYRIELEAGAKGLAHDSRAGSWLNSLSSILQQLALIFLCFQVSEQRSILKDTGITGSQWLCRVDQNLGLFSQTFSARLLISLSAKIVNQQDKTEFQLLQFHTLTYNFYCQYCSHQNFINIKACQASLKS